MDSLFEFSIQTPERTLFTGMVSEAHFASESGAMSFLSRHADFLGAVGYTKVVVHTEEGRLEFVGRRGVVSYDNKRNAGSLLMMDCQLRKELTMVTAKEYLQFIESSLALGTSLSKTQLRFMEEEKYMLERQVEDLAQSEEVMK